MTDDTQPSVDSTPFLRDRTRGSNRRELLRTVTGVATVAGVSHLLGVDDFLAAGDGGVSVTTALVRADRSDPWSLEERTRSVPEDWAEAVRSAVRLNDRLASVRVPGFFGSAVVPGSYDSGTATVSVGVSRETRRIGDLLSTVGRGVSVSVDRFTDLERDTGDIDPDPQFARSPDAGDAPAGVAVEVEGNTATLGAPLHGEGGDGPYFSTAAHALEQVDDSADVTVRVPFESGDSIDLGSVDAVYPTEDVLAIEPGEELRPGYAIGDSSRTVVGQYTRWGLADLVARGEPLEKIGTMTGHTSGAIQGIDAVTCLTDDGCRRGQVRWGGETDLTDGDSGSVSYHPDPESSDDGVLIASLNNARTWWPGQNFVWGVGAYHLSARQGVHF